VIMPRADELVLLVNPLLGAIATRAAVIRPPEGGPGDGSGSGGRPGLISSP
jgi:hypothetical protein